MTNEEFDKTLDGYKELIDEKIRSIIAETSYASEFKEVLEYALFPGGKRLRPVLMLACHGMFSEIDDGALRYACGLEILHSYSLIHDDMPCMDNDLMRRGKPSVHAAYGEGKALLAGDALMDIAYRLLGEPMASGAVSPFWALSRLCGDDGLIGGQYSDLYEEIDTLDKLLAMYKKKTGALIHLSCLSGYAFGNNFDYEQYKKYAKILDEIWTIDEIGGRKGGDFQAVDRFGAAFGAAFQLYDDITEYIDGEKSDGTSVMNFVDLDEAKRMLNSKLNDAAVALKRTRTKNVDFLRMLLNKFIIL